MTEQTQLAWDIIETTNTNLFLTGKAGTGKTTFLRRLKEESSKRIVVVKLPNLPVKVSPW